MGFAVTGAETVVGTTRLRFGGEGRGITGWALGRVDGDVDGLPTRPAYGPPPPATAHPNGAIALDHVVVMTPDLDRTVAALDAIGLPERRRKSTPAGRTPPVAGGPGGSRRRDDAIHPPAGRTQAGGPGGSRRRDNVPHGPTTTQSFRRAGGGVVVEVVHGPDVPEGPARFWGLVVTVADLDAAAEQLGERLGAVKDAVQPGRRIATVRREAGLGLPVALMTP